MKQHNLHKHATIPPRRALIPLRGPSGRLWAMFDPHSQTIEFRHGQEVERFDLGQYQQTPTPAKKGNGE